METIGKQIKAIAGSAKYNTWIINGLIAVGAIQLTSVFANLKAGEEWTYAAIIPMALGALKAILVEGSVKHFSNSVIRMRMAFGTKRGRKSGKAISADDIIAAKKFKLGVVVCASAFANAYYAVCDYAGGSFDLSKLNAGQWLLMIFFSALIPYVVYAMSVDSADENSVLDSLQKEVQTKRRALEKKIGKAKYSAKKQLMAELAKLEAQLV